MFIGHQAVGFAAKAFAPRSRLSILVAAPIFLDLLWPILLLCGVEQTRVDPSQSPFLRIDLYHYPWSHSLLMSLVWSVIGGAIYWLVTRYNRGTIAVSLGIFSHWLLDFVTHRPDMPLYPGGTKVGLGLWYHPAATIIVESIIFLVGIAIYLRATKARDRVGSIALFTYLSLLLVFYTASIVGPPPPGWKPIAIAGTTSWLFLFWIEWIDRHRVVKNET